MNMPTIVDLIVWNIYQFENFSTNKILNLSISRKANLEKYLKNYWGFDDGFLSNQLDALDEWVQYTLLESENNALYNKLKENLIRCFSSNIVEDLLCSTSFMYRTTWLIKNGLKEDVNSEYYIVDMSRYIKEHLCNAQV